MALIEFTLAERDVVSPGLIELASLFALAIIVVGVLYKYTLWRRGIPRGLFSDARKHLGLGGMVKIFFSELGNRVALQKDVITDSRVRRVTHLMIFWGFWLLAFATTWTFIFFRDGTPRPLLDPAKIAGNLGGVMVVVGCAVVLLRYGLFEKYRQGAGFDVAFFSFLLLSTLTGFASEFARLLLLQGELGYVYVVHLVFITGLLLTAPFTHFFHALLVPFERYVGRIHTSLVSMGVTKYSDYRKGAMIESAVAVAAGKESPQYPYWMRAKDKQESKD